MGIIYSRQHVVRACGCQIIRRFDAFSIRGTAFSVRVILQILPIALLLTFLFLTSPKDAFSQGLVITDCQGFTRAARSAEPGTTNRVEVKVESAPGTESPQINLTNTATLETQTVVATNGVAVFENVPPGIFEIATASTNVTLGAVTVSGMAFTALASTSAIVGASLVGGGAVVGAGVAIEEETSGNSSSGRPTPIPTPIPTPNPTAPPQPTLPPPADCGGCDPDATPQPIDPFSPSEEVRALSPTT